MTKESLVVLSILAFAIVLMTTERLRADLVALLLAISLALAGVITPQEAFSGLSHPAVITILALFILTHGLYRTGITRRIGATFYSVVRGRPLGLLLLTMLGSAGLSLFMNNIAAAALLMPAIMDVARRTRTSPSQLLMPLAFGATLGGAATLLTTSNILVSAVLHDQGYATFGLLDFLPVGLPIVVVGILYMLVAGRHLLPIVNTVTQFAGAARPSTDLAETYSLGERLSEVCISGNSPLAGKSLAESRIGENLGLSVLAIRRPGQPLRLAPHPNETLHAGDILLVAGRSERVQKLSEMGGEILAAPAETPDLSTDQTLLLEMTLAPRSAAVGRTLKELRFREKYGLSVVALWRGGRPYRTDVGEIPLQFGDALLVFGPRERVAVLQADPDFLVLTEPEAAPRVRKGWLASAIIAAVLLVATLNLLPIAEAALLGALAMIVTGCLTMDEAYRAVEWRTLFTVAGMLPVSAALTKSGVTDWLASEVTALLSNWGPLAVLGSVLLLATAITQVLSGQVTAALVAPIALAVARQAGADPRMAAMTAALGCSMSFATPTSHPVNIFVMGPGGYRFRDFVRVGLPLTMLELLTVLIALPVFWPSRP